MPRLIVPVVALFVLTCLASVVPAQDHGAHKASSEPAGDAKTTAPTVARADTASLDGVLAAYYASVSGPAGQKRDRPRYLALFFPGARLIPAEGKGHGGVMPRAFSPETYLASVEPNMVEEGFVQTEVARRTERFGKIAQVLSTYEVRRAAGDPQPFVRGVNSFQLFFDGRRWWITSVIWQPETATLSLPDTYLRSPAQSPGP